MRRVKIMAWAALFMMVANGGGSVCLASAAQARLEKVEGDVFFRTAVEGGTWTAAAVGDAVPEKAEIRSGSGATAVLIFEDEANATVEIRPETLINLSKVGHQAEGRDTEIDLLIGSVLVKAEKIEGESKFKVRTPNSIVGIRGTEFEVTVE
ncbi:MAG: FecR domain-containing protein [Candidatus Omnitrophica bacterium]|nr:FecR domain-containing protein [Candidatus Omnitrophota bacterium]